MTMDTLVQAGRQLAESLMPDTAEIRRPGSGGGTDPVTGEWTPTVGTLVYSGRCRIRTPQTVVEQQLVFGDDQVTRTRYLGIFLHAVGDVKIDDMVTVTVSVDPMLLQHRLRVVSVMVSSYLIARRVGLEAIE
ncbi:hypothetical protein BH24ACT15_BH24ACT15_37540 [soil metagenome]